MAPVLPFLPYVSAGLSVVKVVNQDATGRFNQKVFNRNAQIAEQEKEAIAQKTAFDLERFDDSINKLQSQSTVRILTSGADLSGSGLRVLHSNEIQKQIEKNVMTYDSQVQQISKTNEATMARIQGQYARQTGRSAAIGTLFSAAGTFGQSPKGQSLLNNIPNPFGTS
jgi:DNA replication protein DnaD